MNQGIIFNLQKFSLHDGPGIRTTVFLKGCPLRCKWCANPESQLKKIQILYDANKCLHCQKCIQSCRFNAINMIDNTIIIDHQKCQSCLDCVNNCFNQALSNEGYYQDVAKIVKECLKDRDFYEESNGGITISGGEPMYQSEFLYQLVTSLKKHKLHVAIETTGYVDHNTFKQLAPLFDLLLFDVKHVDNTKHLNGTGVNNELIKTNLNWALKHNLNILARIPVIPNFNNSLDDAKQIASYLNSINLNNVQLLPFHQFGERKYQLLNRPYHYHNVPALYPEDLKNYQQIFIDASINCFF